MTAKTAVVSLPRRASHMAAFLLAAGCAALALVLAFHYPLAHEMAVIGCVLSAAVAARYWTRTPLMLALLPLIGFAPWSGWITFEELDMLVLSVAAGAYGALALRMNPAERAPAWRHMLVFSPLTVMLMGLFCISLLVALQRGFADAGGFVFGWYQGYHEAMNSVRLTKSFFMVVLLLPIWVHTGATRPRELSRAMLLGMGLALGTVSLACLWERFANTGILNFSSDYRSTALFWEMHVGGAALDGSLALTLPFAVLALLRARTPRSFLLGMVLVLLGAYACITTFSRGVYLAIPVGLAALVLLRGGQRRRAARLARESVAPLMSVPPLGKFGGIALVIAFATSASQMFPGSGYRGMVALLGAMMLLLAMPASQWLPTRAQRLMSVLMGAALALVVAALFWALSQAVPKAAYVEYVVVLGLTVFLRWLNRPSARPFYNCLLAASWFLLLACVLIVADYWGGDAASDTAWPYVLGLGLLWPALLMWPALWPFKGSGLAGWRSRGLLFGGIVLAAAVISSLGGGAYIMQRASTAQDDMQTRIDHWQQGLAMLETPQDWWLGKGAGRYVASHFFSGPVKEHTGDYRIKAEAGQPYLVLTGGQHVLGFGELFRISQRIAVPKGAVVLKARVRAAQDVTLHAEICEKHLLYGENCLIKKLHAKKGDAWQLLSEAMGDAPPM